MSNEWSWILGFDFWQKKFTKWPQHPVPSGEVVDWIVNEGKFNKWQLVLAWGESGKYRRSLDLRKDKENIRIFTFVADHLTVNEDFQLRGQNPRVLTICCQSLHYWLAARFSSPLHCFPCERENTEVGSQGEGHRKHSISRSLLVNSISLFLFSPRPSHVRHWRLLGKPYASGICKTRGPRVI